MSMKCADCGLNLDAVPVNDPCPDCGGTRRDATIEVPPAPGLAAVSSPLSISLGYTLSPGWGNQWRSAERHLIRLREQYQGVNTVGNLDVEETVHALFLALNHVSDWLYQDTSTGLTSNAVQAFVGQHPGSLGLCCDYANTRKHMRRHAGTHVAQIVKMDLTAGYTVTLGHWPEAQPSAITEVDALAVAEQAWRDWQELLRLHGIPLPP